MIKTPSAPFPPVHESIAETGLESSSALKQCAPCFAAKAHLSGFKSIPKTSAPWAFKIRTANCPIKPNPLTTMRLPGVTLSNRIPLSAIAAKGVKVASADKTLSGIFAQR